MTFAPMRYLWPLLLVSFAANAQPVVSSETELDATSVGPAYNQQQKPAAASDGTNWLVVWEDNRIYILDYVIYGSRIDAAGAALERTNFLIHSEPGVDQLAPAVAYGAGQYLVVWTSGNTVKAKRVSPTGVVDATAVTISNVSSSSPSQVTVGFDGTDFIVVWADARNASSANGYGGDIYAARVSTSLSVRDADGFVVTGETRDQKDPAIVVRGTEVVIAWADSRSSTSSTDVYDIYAARISSGSVIDPNGIAVCTAPGNQSQPAIAYGGGTTLIVWDDERNTSGVLREDVYAARLSGAGVVEDPNGFVVTPGDQTSSGSPNDGDPVVVYAGSQFFVAWENYTSLSGVHVTTAGAVVETSYLNLTTASAEQTEPAVAFNGTELLIVWKDRRTINDTPSYIDVYGQRLTPAGAASGSATLISRSAAHQLNSEVAGGASQLLAVWEDDRPDGTQRIWATRLSPTGQVLDPAGIPISSAAGRTPDVSWDGTHYWVVWVSGGATVHAVRVSTNGTVLDSTPITLSSGAANTLFAPKVASSASNTLVVWARKPSGQNGDLYGMRLSATGTKLDASAFRMTTAFDDENSPDVVFDGANYFVVYQVGTSSGVRALQVDPNGVILSATPITVSSVSGLRPAVAVGGSQYLVTFKVSGTYGAIYAVRVSLQGTVTGSAIPIATAMKVRYETAVAFDGSSFLVAWDGYDETASGSDYAINAARVSPNGAVLDTPFTVAASPKFYDARRPALASLERGKVMALYDREDPTPEVASTRIRARTLTSPVAPSCSANSECTSNFCVDGVCCNSTCGGGAPDDCQACSIAAGGTADGECTSVASGVSCRAATGSCDQAEVCNGSALTCPSDSKVSNGFPCDDGDACTTGDRCMTGACISTGQVSCAGETACVEAGACDPATGQCSAAPKPDATACNDGNACTQTDACQNGTCRGADPVQCTAIDSCHNAGSCNAVTGLCSEPLKPDGSSCGVDQVCSAGLCETVDAGMPMDGGSTDAGMMTDAGNNPGSGAGGGPGTVPPPTPTPAQASGCGCSGAGGTTLFAWSALAALVWSIRRRRSASTPPRS